jgi:hypothetical protein
MLVLVLPWAALVVRPLVSLSCLKSTLLKVVAGTGCNGVVCVCVSLFARGQRRMENGWSFTCSCWCPLLVRVHPWAIFKPRIVWIEVDRAAGSCPPSGARPRSG